jgi:flagellar motor switch/type III secretory pathway protein FliN
MTPLEELSKVAKMPLEIEAVLDHRIMTVAEILDLEPGSLIRMNRSAGENVEVHIGGVHVADGDIVEMENMLCVRLTDFRERH